MAGKEEMGSPSPPPFHFRTDLQSSGVLACWSGDHPNLLIGILVQAGHPFFR